MLAQRLSREAGDCDSEGEDSSPVNSALSEEGLAELKASSVPYREELHGLLAIEVARRAKIFDNEASSWSTATTHTPRNASDDDLQTISSWANQLLADVEKKNTRAPPPPSTQPTQTPSIRPVTHHEAPSTADVSLLSCALASSEEALDGIDVSHLRPDQARAYGIIRWHLD